MLDRCSGDIGKALAAYNWGPANLDRSQGALPEDTRHYLQAVLAYYGVLYVGNNSIAMERRPPHPSRSRYSVR